MKLFTNFALVCTLLTAASAQRAFIGYPQEGVSLQSGSQFTVEVDRPNSLTGSKEVAIVIGINSCAASPCPSPANVLGNILYNGAYNPQFSNITSKPPHQNFTVTLPAALAKGPAQLGVAHVSLVGAGPFPFLETMNITINVV